MKRNAEVHRRDTGLAARWALEFLESRTLLAVFTPTTGTQFQSALNTAALGDDIILQAGTTYVGQFTLPNKTTGSGWITIKSSNVHLLPGEGVRVAPADAVNMARLQAPGGNASVVRTATSAHHFKFIGIEFVGPANNTNLTALVTLGTDTQNTIAAVPKYLVFDRSYFRPSIPTAHIRRAIALNSGDTDITNSYIQEIHEPGSDSQAIGGWNGTGNYNIINNRLEGASENIMFGGAATRIPGVVPTNIVIRGNHIIKPLHWKGLVDPASGLQYNIKNHFELKHGKDVLFEGNILENCWVNGQTGVSIVLKLGDFKSTPWNVTENVVIRNNIIRNAVGGVSLQGRDYAAKDAAGNPLDPGGNVRKLSFINNVFENISAKFLLLTHGPKDVTFDHNTIFNGSNLIDVDANSSTYPNTNFKFDNNIADHNSYGVFSSIGIGNATFNTYFTDAGHSFDKNLLVNVPHRYRNNYTARPTTMILREQNNENPDLWHQVGFVDLAGGNYRLAPTSPYNNAGTDGKDLGADIDEIELRTAGVISGLWQQALQMIVVNNGEAQRSKVTTVTLTFNQPITSTAGALDLDRRGGSGVTVVATPSADKKTYTLTFTGAGIESGSLADGIYDFLADVSEFRDAFNLMPVGTHTDEDRTLAFHRLFGDFEGNRTVNNFDYSRFNSTFGKTSSQSGYLSLFDFDNNGIINNFDYAQFKTRYGAVLTY